MQVPLFLFLVQIQDEIAASRLEMIDAYIARIVHAPDPPSRRSAVLDVHPTMLGPQLTKAALRATHPSRAAQPLDGVIAHCRHIAVSTRMDDGGGTCRARASRGWVAAMVVVA